MFNKEIEKRHLVTFHGNGCIEEKCFINNENLVDSNCHWKNRVYWMSANQEKSCNLKKVIFCGKRKFKLTLKFLHCLPLKIYISWLPATILLLKSDSHFPKKFVSYASIKPFKDDEKCFLLHLKSSFSFLSQGI